MLLKTLTYATKAYDTITLPVYAAVQQPWKKLALHNADKVSHILCIKICIFITVYLRYTYQQMTCTSSECIAIPFQNTLMRFLSAMQWVVYFLRCFILPSLLSRDNPDRQNLQ